MDFGCAGFVANFHQFPHVLGFAISQFKQCANLVA